MQKIKKHHYGFISRQNVTGYVECDTKKKKLSFRSIPTRFELRIPKSSKKMQKIKSIIWLHFKPKRDETG